MHEMLRIPPCDRTTFVLVSPHYPENVGAAARAMKTMGIVDLLLVNPGRLAVPDHEMAFKMAVKSWDVLQGARIHASLADALATSELVFTTSGRTGQSGVLLPRQAAEMATRRARDGQRIAVVFGNEKTGLTSEDLARGTHAIRIPMAAPQPSINLAQACQVIAYEWFSAGLLAREEELRAAKP
jgi:TrmH family RNA methyltransferase